jgi:hypothetical protein
MRVVGVSDRQRHNIYIYNYSATRRLGGIYKTCILPHTGNIESKLTPYNEYKNVGWYSYAHFVLLCVIRFTRTLLHSVREIQLSFHISSGGQGQEGNKDVAAAFIIYQQTNCTAS